MKKLTLLSLLPVTFIGIAACGSSSHDRNSSINTNSNTNINTNSDSRKNSKNNSNATTSNHLRKTNSNNSQTYHQQIKTNTAKKTTQAMSQARLLKLLENNLTGYTLLDVRTPAEYAQGHIAGAINISHEQILQNISLLDAYKNTDIILYCRSGRRAKLVTDLLENLPYLKGIHHLTGDINAWNSQNLALVTP